MMGRELARVWTTVAQSLKEQMLGLSVWARMVAHLQESTGRQTVVGRLCWRRHTATTWAKMIKLRTNKWPQQAARKERATYEDRQTPTVTANNDSDNSLSKTTISKTPSCDTCNATGSKQQLADNRGHEKQDRQSHEKKKRKPQPANKEFFESPKQLSAMNQKNKRWKPYSKLNDATLIGQRT